MTPSPLPWELVNRFHTITGKPMTEIIAAKWHTVCDNDPLRPQSVSPADQSLIVTAVNAHAALVAALEEMVLRCDINPTADYHIRARAALELARKGGA